MADFRGPLDASGMATFLVADSQVACYERGVVVCWVLWFDRFRQTPNCCSNYTYCDMLICDISGCDYRLTTFSTFSILQYRIHSSVHELTS